MPSCKQFCRCVAVGLLHLCLLPAIGLADTYRVGPGDVLSLRVLEWQPIEYRAVEWESMRTELPVGADGMLSVPFLGRISAESLSLAELSAIVTEGLQERLAISATLDAVVQVATYRPVYVAGFVRNPGEYPFRPGLTAAQLVAQAGGGGTGAAIDTRDLLTREGTMRVLRLEGERLAIRQAMLKAAIDGLDKLVVPPRQEGTVWPPDLVSSENELLRLRKEQQTRQIAALDNQIALLQNEIEALSGRAKAMERLIESARQENDSAQSLAERGLAATARVAETERTLALTEAQLLDVSTSTLRARQGIALAEAEKLALRDRQLVEDRRELQRVEEALERVLANLETQEALAIAETGLVLRDGSAEGERMLAQPNVTILRGQGDAAVHLSGLDTPLAPGDVVTVAAPRNWGRGFDDQGGIANQ